MSTTPPNTSNIDIPLSGCLSVIPGTDENCPDEKLSYTRVAQNGSTVMNTLLMPPPHPSNIPNIEPSPSGNPDR